MTRRNARPVPLRYGQLINPPVPQRLAELGHYFSPDSGAPDQVLQGIGIGVVCLCMSQGLEFRDAIDVLASVMPPIGVARVEALPPTWFTAVRGALLARSSHQPSEAQQKAELQKIVVDMVHNAALEDLQRIAELIKEQRKEPMA